MTTTLKQSLIYFITTSFIFIAFACYETHATNKDNKNVTSAVQVKPKSLSSIVDSLNLKKGNISIFIDKGAFTLSVISDTLTLKTFDIVLGTNPVDDKLMQGDRATPEGKFKVRASYPHKSWSKFIWIDYPTDDSWKKHNLAKIKNRIPKDAKIGDEIGIHGVPDNSDYLIKTCQNWTWGCISLSNTDVNEIYEIVYDGMPIEIIK